MGNDAPLGTVAGRLVIIVSLPAERAVSGCNSEQLQRELEGAFPMLRVDTALDVLVESSSRADVEKKLQSVVECEGISVGFDVSTIRAMGGECAEHAAAWFKSDDLYYHVVRAYEAVCAHRSGRAYVSRYPAITIAAEQLASGGSRRLQSRIELIEDEMGNDAPLGTVAGRLVIIVSLPAERAVSGCNSEQLQRELENASAVGHLRRTVQTAVNDSEQPLLRGQPAAEANGPEPLRCPCCPVM
jgi:hypothetical protein